MNFRKMLANPIMLIAQGFGVGALLLLASQLLDANAAAAQSQSQASSGTAADA